jgi:heme/copper-type cytochrome/quinol oxidase subunit 2
MRIEGLKTGALVWAVLGLTFAVASAWASLEFMWEEDRLGGRGGWSLVLWFTFIVGFGAAAMVSLVICLALHSRANKFEETRRGKEGEADLEVPRNRRVWSGAFWCAVLALGAEALSLLDRHMTGFVLGLVAVVLLVAYVVLHTVARIAARKQRKRGLNLVEHRGEPV